MRYIIAGVILVLFVYILALIVNLYIEFNGEGVHHMIHNLRPAKYKEHHSDEYKLSTVELPESMEAKRVTLAGGNTLLTIQPAETRPFKGNFMHLNETKLSPVKPYETRTTKENIAHLNDTELSRVKLSETRATKQNVAHLNETKLLTVKPCETRATKENVAHLNGTKLSTVKPSETRATKENVTHLNETKLLTMKPSETRVTKENAVHHNETKLPTMKPSETRVTKENVVDHNDTKLQTERRVTKLGTIKDNDNKLNDKHIIHVLDVKTKSIKERRRLLNIRKLMDQCSHVTSNPPMFKDKTKSVNSLAIAILIAWDFQQDIDDVINKMLFSIQKLEPTVILMFSDTVVPTNVKQTIAKFTQHTVKHVRIDFTFPKGFNESSASPWTKRSKWGYMHMCRFWFRNIWLQPEIQEFQYILRLDSDSCLYRNKVSFPFDNELIYMSNRFTWEYGFIEGLHKTIKDFVQQKAIKPRNQHLYKLFLKSTRRLPMWYNNVEVTSVKFMNNPEVRRFTEFIDATHGLYKYRWGDAPLRFATVALFAPPNTVKSLNFGKCYHHPC